MRIRHNLPDNLAAAFEQGIHESALNPNAGGVRDEHTHSFAYINSLDDTYVRTFKHEHGRGGTKPHSHRASHSEFEQHAG